MPIPTTLRRSLTPRRLAAGAILLVIGVAAVSWLIMRPEPIPEGAAHWRARVLPDAPPAAFELVTSEDTPTSTILHLRWPAGVVPVSDPPPLILTLPAGRPIKARWVELRRGEERVWPPVPTPTPTPRFTEEGPPEAPPDWLAQPVRVEWAGWIRHWPIHKVGLPPGFFEIAGVGRADRPTTTPIDIALEISWPPSPDAPAAAAPASSKQDLWRPVAEAIVLNDAALDRHAIADPPLPGGMARRPAGPRSPAPDAPWARIRVDRPGLYRIVRDDLLRAGFPPAEAAFDSVRVFSRSEPVPVIRIAEGDDFNRAGFRPGVYFWGRPGDTAYSRERIYWVTLAPALADPQILPVDIPATDPMPVQPVVRLKHTREIDSALVTLHGSFLAVEGMAWIESPLEPAVDLNLPIELPHYRSDGTSITATLRFLVDRDTSYQIPRVEVRAGGMNLATLAVDRFNPPPFPIQIPAAALTDGRTTLTLRLLDGMAASPDAAGPGLWFDGAEFNYPAAPLPLNGRLPLEGDAGTPWRLVPLRDLGPRPLPVVIGPDGDPRGLAPLVTRDGEQMVVRPAGAGRVEVLAPGAVIPVPRPEAAPAEALADTPGADLLIIAHGQFLGEARRLARHRESRGTTTRLVDVQAVYDAFSGGELSPDAIRAFAAHALRHWTPVPSAILLVGDANSDYLDIARQGIRNWVPSYSFHNGSDTWASDSWFATVAGDDDFPDLAVGRLSAASTDDLAAMVDKIIAADARPRTGPVRSRLAFISDDGEFPEVVEALRRDHTPPAYASRRVYLNELPVEDNWYLPESLVERKRMKVSRAATADILALFRTGSAMMTFYGHGSPNIWSDERIWFGGDSRNSDNLHLTDTGNPTFVVNMTCNSGAIDYPERPWNICISEDLLRVPDGGALAAFVPSGPSVTYIHRRFSEALHEAIFTDGARNFGAITSLTRLRYLLAGNPRELAYMYILLGDPYSTLPIARPAVELTLEPGVVAPGGDFAVDLPDLPLHEGQWVAEVEAGGERLWWTRPASIRGGQLRVAGHIPPSTPAGPALLRIYLWDGTGREHAFAGRFRIASPVLEFAGLDAEGSTIHAEVHNPGPLAGRAKLLIHAGDSTASTMLLSRSVTLEPGERDKFTADAPPAGDEPIQISAYLRLPESPADPSRPQLIRRSTWIVPPGYEGFLPGSAAVEADARGGGLRVRARARARSAAVAGVDDPAGRSLTSATLTAAREGSAPIEFLLPPGTPDLLSSGTLWLAESTTGSRIASLPLAGLPRPAPRLRIVPGSIVHEPEMPTDGETVFVTLEVENTGDVAAEGASVRLLPEPTGAGIEPLPDMMGHGRVDLPPLAPGRRAPVRLRWDPHANAGTNEVYVHVATEFGDIAPGPERLARHTVTVLTKPELRVVRAWSEASRGEIRARRVNLLAVVANDGETAARNVSVAFYRGSLQTPENRVGEVEIAAVDGLSSATAQIVWEFDEREISATGQLPPPSVQVSLRGSSQRVLSDPDTGTGPVGGAGR